MNPLKDRDERIAKLEAKIVKLRSAFDRPEMKKHQPLCLVNVKMPIDVCDCHVKIATEALSE